MRSLPVFALPEVETDLRAATAHYASWRADGAEHILRKYDETTGWIAWNPEAFPKRHGPIRRAILKQSYYLVYFLIEADRTLSWPFSTAVGIRGNPPSCPSAPDPTR